jgi:DNA-binding NarL/FixJ family response regulator
MRVEGRSIMNASTTRIPIVIADDHPIFRKGLCQLVERHCDVIGEANSGDTLLALMPDCLCRVVVLDLAMPGGEGLAVLRELRRLRPDVPVLVLSASPENQYAFRCIRAGASGYLTKQSAPDDLVEAITRVAAGGLYVSARLGRQLAEDTLRPPRRSGARANRLSDREFEVLCLFAAGETTTSISARLGVSVKTVSTYRRRLLTKLELPNLAALIRYALENHLIQS